MRFSANLGFLWTELPLSKAIERASENRFDAVEFHYPYDTPAEEIRAALTRTGLTPLGLNTRTGDNQMGFAAIPGAEAQADANLDEALEYATAIGARAVHVLAGWAEGAEARASFVAHLKKAADKAADLDLTILIEPLNRFDAPGYFLNTLDMAESVLSDVDRANAKLMFDCYHVGRTEGDVAHHFERLLPLIGHVQFAGTPDRGPPEESTLDYRSLFARIAELGWSDPLGAEYRPKGATEDGLDWMDWGRSL